MSSERPSTRKEIHNNCQALLRYESRFRARSGPREAVNTRTTTVKQIHSACSERTRGGRFVLNNSQVYTVRLCGRIIEIDQNDGYTRFKIDDGTGTAEAIIRSYGTNIKTDLIGATLGAYYIVVANVSKENNSILLHALKARMVINHNDISLHMLSAIHEDLSLSRLAMCEDGNWHKKQDAANTYARSNLNLNLNKEAIVTLLSKDHIRESIEGACIDYVIDQLQMTDQDGREALQSMLEEGSIYNTIDYNHFKMADET